MKRSEINRAIRAMEAMIERCRFQLPPFCHYPAKRWQSLGDDHAEIVRAGLGWDITDYGLGDFSRIGLALITLRNGYPGSPKSYAEKLLYLEEKQTAPMHFHYHKMEDIINRGGANVRIQLYQATDDNQLSLDDVTVWCDGVRQTVPAGSIIELSPGQSISLPPRLYHDFSVAPGRGPVLLGEVSSVNDDARDNHFLHPVGRFPQIIEDEPAYRLLCHEYPELSDQA